MNCSECGVNFRPSDPEEEICPKCQLLGAAIEHDDDCPCELCQLWREAIENAKD
jgi:hypothetical protein